MLEAGAKRHPFNACPKLIRCLTLDARGRWLRVGTQMEMKEAEDEWVLRPYMHTAKRRHALDDGEDDVKL